MPAPSSSIDWTDQTISTLRTLWDEGHPTAEIGRRMQTSKNSIVGKAHRLKLPARPSLIRGVPRERAAPAPGPLMPVPMPASPLPRRPVAPLPPVATPELPPPVTPPVRLAPPPVSPRPTASPPPLALIFRGGCQWPFGEPGSAGFHLCEEAAVASRPYCEEHCRRAYVRPARVLAAADLDAEGRP